MPSWRSDPQLPAGFLVGADDSTSADLRRLFDHAHDALFLVDRSGAVACCNINAANLVSAGYVLTKTIDARLKFLDFETARKYQSALNGVFVQKTTFDVFQVCSSCHPTFQISVHCAQKSFGQDYAIVTARNVAETLSLRARLAESHFSLTPVRGQSPRRHVERLHAAGIGGCDGVENHHDP